MTKDKYAESNRNDTWQKISNLEVTEMVWQKINQLEVKKKKRQVSSDKLEIRKNDSSDK